MPSPKILYSHKKDTMPVTLRNRGKGVQGVQSPTKKRSGQASPVKKGSAGSNQKRTTPPRGKPTTPRKLELLSAIHKKKPTETDDDPTYTSPSSSEESHEEPNKKSRASANKTKKLDSKEQGKESGPNDPDKGMTHQGDEKETTATEHQGPVTPINETQPPAEGTPPPQQSLTTKCKEAAAKSDLSETDDSEAGLQGGDTAPRTPSPYPETGSSFEDFYPFVTDRKGSPEKSKQDDSSRRAFVDTYSNFQEYMVGIKSNERPAVAHRKASSIIDIERDGTSFVVYYALTC
jgi:hypothetical protein